MVFVSSEEERRQLRESRRAEQELLQTLEESKGGPFWRFRPNSNRRLFGSARRACFYYWERGHKAEKCPYNPGDYCRNCGRWEETLLTCPRCSRIHRRDMVARFEADHLSAYRKSRHRHTALPEVVERVKKSASEPKIERCGLNLW